MKLKSNYFREITILTFLIIFWLFFIVAYPKFTQAVEMKPFEPGIAIPGVAEDIQASQTFDPGTLAYYISNFYKWSVIALAVLAVVIIMVSGLRWIFAAGNPPAIKQAQDQLFAALIGLVLILIAVPMLSLINPALVKLSTFKIPSIARINVGINIDFEDLLSPPDEWFDVDKEPTAGAKACGTETLYKAEGENTTSFYYGVVCDEFLDHKTICYLPFEIDKDDLEAWNKGEEKDFAGLILLRKEVKGKKTGCIAVTPGNTIWVPANEGGNTTIGFDIDRPCGEVKSTYVGTKCQFAGETCVISAIWEVDESFNETGTSIWAGNCLPVAVEKTCPAYEIRVSCLPNCGFPPPTNCMDVPVEDLTETDKICCQDAQGVSHLR